MSNMPLSDSDIVGAVQRGLSEALSYLSDLPPSKVDVSLVLRHLERAMVRLSELRQIEAAQPAIEAETAKTEAA